MILGVENMILENGTFIIVSLIILAILILATIILLIRMHTVWSFLCFVCVLIYSSALVGGAVEALGGGELASEETAISFFFTICTVIGIFLFIIKETGWGWGCAFFLLAYFSLLAWGELLAGGEKMIPVAFIILTLDGIFLAITKRTG